MEGWGKRGGPVQLQSASMKLKREGATEFRECADEVEEGESNMKIVPRHIIRVEKHGWEL